MDIKLQIFEILSYMKFVERWWCENKTLKNSNSLPDLIKLMKFWVIVQKDKLHNISDYIL